ncbi:E3 ubiquitin-protein ligase TRIM39-like [Pelodytes ibericus]
MASVKLREELDCSVCLHIYTDPVMLSCGHNFCRVCMENVLDTQEGSGVYTCPECRAEFQERPALQRNRMLCNIAELFLCVEPEPERDALYCTYCDLAIPALKRCVHCEVSLCASHLKAHNKAAEHILTEPTHSQQNRTCSSHRKILEYYCLEDETCICVSCCLAGQHKGHKVEVLDKAAEKKKERLRKDLVDLTSQRQKIDKRLLSLQVHRREAQDKAVYITERTTDLFRDIKEELETLEKQVMTEISREKEQVFTYISDMIQHLQTNSDELAEKMRHTEKLCNTDDPLIVLQAGDFDSAHPYDRETLSNEFRGSGDDDMLCEQVNLDETSVSIRLERGLQNLADILPVLKAKRGIFMQEASDLLLDINTCPTDGVWSNDLNVLTYCRNHRKGQEDTDPQVIYQVFSNRSFVSGQHYWEVETSKSGNWRIGVRYPRGDVDMAWDCIGSDNRSWCLWKWDVFTSVKHNAKQDRVYLDPFTHKYGIYLDYEAGRLSFYQLSLPIKHLHTFTATFTEPLHAAFLVYMGGWVRIVS